MFLKCGYLSAREILRMIRTNRTTNYPALGKKCRIVDVESRDAVYRSTTVTDIGPCAPKTRACSISAVFDGPDMKHPYSKSSNSGRARASCIVSTSASRGMRIIRPWHRNRGLCGGCPAGSIPRRFPPHRNNRRLCPGRYRSASGRRPPCRGRSWRVLRAGRRRWFWRRDSIGGSTL